MGKINESGSIKEEGSKECTLFSEAIQEDVYLNFQVIYIHLPVYLLFFFRIARRVEYTFI